MLLCLLLFANAAVTHMPILVQSLYNPKLLQLLALQLYQRNLYTQQGSYCSTRTYCSRGCPGRWRRRSRRLGSGTARDRSSGTGGNRARSLVGQMPYTAISEAFPAGLFSAPNGWKIHQIFHPPGTQQVFCAFALKSYVVKKHHIVCTLFFERLKCFLFFCFKYSNISTTIISAQHLS